MSILQELTALSLPSCRWRRAFYASRLMNIWC